MTSTILVQPGCALPGSGWLGARVGMRVRSGVVSAGSAVLACAEPRSPKSAHTPTNAAMSAKMLPMTTFMPPVDVCLYAAKSPQERSVRPSSSVPNIQTNLRLRTPITKIATGKSRMAVKPLIEPTNTREPTTTTKADVKPHAKRTSRVGILTKVGASEVSEPRGRMPTADPPRGAGGMPAGHRRSGSTPELRGDPVVEELDLGDGHYELRGRPEVGGVGGAIGRSLTWPRPRQVSAACSTIERATSCSPAHSTPSRREQATRP